MTDGYRVSGGHGDAVPGALGPSDLDGRAEWVHVDGRGIAERLEARLGSEVDLRKILFGVLVPLLGALHGEPLRAIAARLPHALARELLDEEDGAVRGRIGAGEYLRDVAELVQHPPRAAAIYAGAVLAAVREALPAETAAEVERRLPPELLELWRDAR
ncbi:MULTISPECIES: DUF2267 domain-containing protein [Anaeromyxobacter]|uniref:DUF2267 domain-containing protein n=1 Tax=Anaeromyxobacter TaxID=161492 RepID=UPI001F570CC8|nr:MULTISPECIES: DUF2267 domain-containing protein [unclassified Anaeromyxobacter]